VLLELVHRHEMAWINHQTTNFASFSRSFLSSSFFLSVPRVPVFCHGIAVILVNAMQGYGKVEVWLHQFSISSQNEGEWLSLRPGRYTPRGRNLSGPIGLEVGWVPLLVWTGLELSKIFCPCRYLNHDCEHAVYKAMTAVFHYLIWRQNSVTVT